jgi:hypothetical protein
MLAGSSIENRLVSKARLGDGVGVGERVALGAGVLALGAGGVCRTGEQETSVNAADAARSAPRIRRFRKNGTASSVERPPVRSRHDDLALRGILSQ